MEAQCAQGSTELIYNWSSFKPKRGHRRRPICGAVHLPVRSQSTHGLERHNHRRRYHRRRTITGCGDCSTIAVIKRASSRHGKVTPRIDGKRCSYRKSRVDFDSPIAKPSRSEQRKQCRTVRRPRYSPDGSDPGFRQQRAGRIVLPQRIRAAHWYGPDPDFLRDNTAVVRPLFGLPVTEPNFNPTQAFTDTEKTYAGYVQANYSHWKRRTGAQGTTRRALRPNRAGIGR